MANQQEIESGFAGLSLDAIHDIISISSRTGNHPTHDSANTSQPPISKLQQTFVECCKSGDADGAERLLNNPGVHPRAVDADNHTALYHSLLSRNDKLVEAILARSHPLGSMPDIVDVYMTAAYLGCADVVSECLTTSLEADGFARPLKYYASPRSGMSPLHVAAYSGKAEIVNLMIRAEVYHDPEDWEGTTPLALAALGGHRDVVRVLLRYGASGFRRNTTSGEGLIMQIAKGPQKPHSGDVVSMLMYCGVDPNEADGDGQTALHLAALANNYEVVHALLQHPMVKPDGRATYHHDGNEYKDRNALHYLAQGRGADKTGMIVKELMEARTDTCAADGAGLHPIDVAVRSGNIPMLEYFAIRTGPCWSSTISACGS